MSAKYISTCGVSFLGTEFFHFKHYVLYLVLIVITYHFGVLVQMVWIKGRGIIILLISGVLGLLLLDYQQFGFLKFRTNPKYQSENMFTIVGLIS